MAGKLAYSIDGDTLYWSRKARQDIEHALHNADDNTDPLALQALREALNDLDVAGSRLDPEHELIPLAQAQAQNPQSLEDGICPRCGGQMDEKGTRYLPCCQRPDHHREIMEAYAVDEDDYGVRW